jgi:D-aminoacyl-tRNA deacylase
MRAVVQRVKNARVVVEGEERGRIGQGLLVYVGIAVDDGPEDAAYLAKKVTSLRIFPDAEEKMNLSLKESGGGALVISQFTLMADARKGRRPSFSAAADPAAAVPVYEKFLCELQKDVAEVASGVFRTHMEVSYTNVGPVTMLLDSKKIF